MSEHYFCFFPGDYHKDTQGLSLTEHGAYHLLLDVYYSQGFLSDDMAEVYRICRAFEPFERTAADKVVSRYFTKSDGRLINSRAEREIAFRRKQAENSAKGGEATKEKWKRIKEGPKDSPKEGPKDSPKQGSLSPSLSLEEKNKHTGEKFILPEWFPSETWSVFLSHRKEVRAKVTPKAFQSFVKKFAKLRDQGFIPEVVVDKMVEKGWRWFKPEWLKDEPQPPRKNVCRKCGLPKSNLLSDGICWQCKEKESDK